MSSALANEDQMAENLMAMLPIELMNATGTYLHDLNDDRLLEIFSSNTLTPMDLCSVAETCKRFKQITQRMFSTGFAIKRHYSGRIYTFSSNDHAKLKCTFQNTERILKNFGLHLSELCVDGDLALVNLVAKYCDDITLKRLEIRDLESIEGVTQQLGSIFQRLLELRVYKCNLPIASSDMNFDSLIELDISCCNNGAALLTNTFPVLERFCFCSNHTTINGKYDNDNAEALSEFFKRHGCLKAVEVGGELFKNREFLLAISSCNELEELVLGDFCYNWFDISHLQNLSKLKILKIRFDGDLYGLCDRSQCEDIDFSRALQSLKTVEISEVGDRYAVPNHIYDVLSQLQGLRELKLNNCDLNNIPWTRLTQIRKLHVFGGFNDNNDSFLLGVIEQLINLEEFKWIFFYVHYKLLLSEEMFSKIVKLVQRRSHVLTLRCHYNFIYEENCKENHKVKLIKL